jgi:hypothetical protein
MWTTSSFIAWLRTCSSLTLPPTQKYEAPPTLPQAVRMCCIRLAEGNGWPLSEL